MISSQKHGQPNVLQVHPGSNVVSFLASNSIVLFF